MLFLFYHPKKMIFSLVVMIIVATFACDKKKYRGVAQLV